MTRGRVVRIRDASALDAPDVLAIYRPLVEQTAVSFEERPPTLAEMERRVADSHLWLVAEQSSRVVGYAYAGRFHARPAYRWSAEVSIYLGDGARGKGLGRRLLNEVLRRLTARGFVNAFAGIALPNPASVGLFESAGFQKIAHQRQVGFKLGSWHDVGWWQLQLRERTVPPPELIL